MVELINKRRLDSKAFDTGKTRVDPVTKKTLPIFATKIQKGLHYRKNGGLHDIDTTVFEQTEYEFTHKVDKTRVILRFGDNSGNTKKHLFGIEDDKGNWLNVKLNRAGHDMSGVPGNRPTFPTGGITVEHIPTYKGVKTNYRLGSSGVNELVVTFKYNQELTPEQRGNTIVFLRDGKVIFIVESPFAYDAADETNHIEPVIMVLGETGGFKSATITVDSEWLSNAIDPIIDPNVTIDDDSGTFNDAFMESGSLADRNTGGMTTLNIRNQGPTNRYHGLMSVDLSAYPVTPTLAYFGVNLFTGNFPLDTAWHRVLKPWYQGISLNTTANTREVTWNSQSHNETLWAVAGCMGDGTDRQAAAEGTATITAINADYHFDMSLATVQAWCDSSANNHGIMIDAPTTFAFRDGLWYSSNNGSNLPYFYMEYTERVNQKISGTFGIGRLGLR